MMDFCSSSQDYAQRIVFHSKACFTGEKRKELEPFLSGVYYVKVEATSDELKEPFIKAFKITKGSEWGEIEIEETDIFD